MLTVARTQAGPWTLVCGGGLVRWGGGAFCLAGTAPGTQAPGRRLSESSPLSWPPHPCRKRPLSPQSKSSSKVTSVPGKASDTSTTATAGTKSGKASTLSRREELLKQLKAVEDAIARKRAKIPGKV